MKTTIKFWNVFVYIVGSAAVGGFLLSAVPALTGNDPLTKTLGLIGCIVGGVAGLVIGITRRFR